jgi:hypothetical protein
LIFAVHCRFRVFITGFALIPEWNQCSRTIMRWRLPNNALSLVKYTFQLAVFPSEEAFGS